MSTTTIGLSSGSHIGVSESRAKIREIMSSAAHFNDGICTFTDSDGFNRKFDVKEKDIVYLSYAE